MATDPSNDMLLTGDSTGRMTIWDISTYCISRTESIIAQVNDEMKGRNSNITGI